MRDRVLIVVHTNTFFVELFRLAKYLGLSRDYDVIIMFARQYPTCREDVSQCSQLRIQCIDAHGKRIHAGDDTQVHGAPRLTETKGRIGLQRLRRSLKMPYAILSRFYRQSGLGQLIDEYRTFRNAYRTVKSVLSEQNPSSLVLGGDMVGYDTSVYIDVAHQRNIPAIILPSTMSNGLEQAEAYFHDPNHGIGKGINRLAAKLYPKWVRMHRGRKLLRVPGARALVMEYFGLAPPFPWSFNSGFADAIAVESEYMRRYYLDCGIPDRQLKLTGSLADDLMADILRRKDRKATDLCKELGLSEDKPILLSALPPDSFCMTGGRPESEFGSYPELVRFWIESIAKVEGYNVVVCLHPSARVEEFLYVENWGVKIARRGTAELVPLCGLYVASVSSTIRWAIACGIPVINYDVYRYRYTDYLDVAGVIAVEKRSEFESVLNRMAMDTDFYRQKMADQKRAASQWGMFDGKAAERLEALLISTIKACFQGKHNGE